MRTANDTTVNHLLRQERIGRNWRQKDLAEQLGTTTVTVKRWERGYQQPSDYFHIKLCTLFGKSAEELGLVTEDPSFPIAEDDVSGTEQATSSPAEPLALWTVPYMRNPHFTGRDDLLDQLVRHLSYKGQDDAMATRQAVLSQPQAVRGLGGIGKTQIAVEYAYRSREQGYHRHILWINAASEEAIITSFRTLADVLPDFPDKDEKNLRQLIAAVKRWFEQCQESWLLIFDNADELALVQPHVPVQGQGSILLTTRATAVAWLANPVEVEQMGLVEGTTFLLHRAQRLHVSDEEFNEASNLVIALDGFPLALDQAGAYIEETGCSFGDYLCLYERHRTILLARRGRQASNYPNSVATTWSLSFEQIEQDHPAAAELLRLCAYLSPDHIPEELLTNGATYWPAVLQEAVSDSLRFNELLEALLAFSLVKRLAQQHLLSLHRLVQVVQMDQMDSQEQRVWAERVIRAVNALFPTDPREKIETWPQCLRYLEQVQACDGLIQQHHLQLQEAADLLGRAGVYLQEHASYNVAEPLIQRALSITEQELGHEHLQVASFLNSLGTLYHRQGRYELAESMYQRALHIREQNLDPQDPQIAYLLGNLGRLYKDQGRNELAESCYKRVLHIFEQNLDPQDPQVARILNNLGLLYSEQGQYQLAQPLLQQSLHIWEQALGPDHPRVGRALDSLGVLYLMQGQYQLAQPVLQRSLHIWEQALGLDHPEVAYPLANLGELYFEQGQYELASPLYQRALHIQEQALGPDHPHVAYILINLGNLYYQQGQYELAKSAYQRALYTWEQAPNPHHPRVAHPLNGLANISREHGHYEQADALYQQALLLRQKHLGLQHPEVADTLQDLARLRGMQQQPAEALSHYQQALAIREQVYGSQHPKTEKTRTAITQLLQNEKR